MSSDFLAADFRGFTRIRRELVLRTVLKGRNNPRALAPEGIAGRCCDPNPMMATTPGTLYSVAAPWNERDLACI
jgi:hypothetical protein